MIDTEELKRYKQYLNTIDKQLEEFFDDQKEYMCCKKGCGHCCERGAYPYSELEFSYLLLGFLSLRGKVQQDVIRRIQELKERYKDVENKRDLLYRCPFLDDEKVCTVYEYRGLICRTFGLLTVTPSGKTLIPFCQSRGLNYSKVFDSANRKIDYDLVEKYGFKNPPKAFKTNLYSLTDPSFFVGEPIVFGEIKSMIEWL